MAYDPLGENTRQYRRWLLATSVAAITVKTFEVTIETVPAAGFSIKFPHQFLPFVLTIGVLYFLISFTIYIIDDIRNITTTPRMIMLNKLIESMRRHAGRDLVNWLSNFGSSTEYVEGTAKFLLNEVEEICQQLLIQKKYNLSKKYFVDMAGKVLISKGADELSEEFESTDWIRNIGKILHAYSKEYFQTKNEALKGERVMLRLRLYIWDCGFSYLVALTALMAIADLVSLAWFVVPGGI